MMMVEVGVTHKAFFPAWNFTGLNGRTTVVIRNFPSKAITSSFPNGLSSSAPTSYFTSRRPNRNRSSPLVSALVTDVRACSSQFADFQVVRNSTDDSTVLKISVEVCGTKTKAIFDDVFDTMVEAAQPIPGFRRVKGGKTPNIPKDVLLEILGASRVYKQVIQKVINSCVAEYVDKQGLQVGNDLKVEQSFEDLEDAFNPGDKFNFDALLSLHLN